jgi:PAS domain S-box-containing protein
MTSTTELGFPAPENSPDSPVDLFDHTPIPLILVDKAGHILRANPAECRMLGYTAQEMLGKHVWEFVADDEQDLSKGRFQAFLGGMELSISLRRRFRTKAHDLLICELSAQLIRCGQLGDPFVLLATVDVTQHVTEACVRGDFSRWMEASFRSLPESTVILDTLGHIRHLNRAAERLLECSEAQAAGPVPEIRIQWTALLSSEGEPVNFDFEERISKGWAGSVTATIKGGAQKRLRVRTEPLVAANGIVLGISCCLSPIE